MRRACGVEPAFALPAGWADEAPGDVVSAIFWGWEEGGASPAVGLVVDGRLPCKALGLERMKTTYLVSSSTTTAAAATLSLKRVSRVAALDLQASQRNGETDGRTKHAHKKKSRFF